MTGTASANVPTCALVPSIILSTAALMTSKPRIPASTAIMRPAMGSALLWPNGCPSSACVSEMRTQMKTAIDAAISLRELRASDMRAIEPEARPAASFRTKRPVLPTIFIRVALKAIGFILDLWRRDGTGQTSPNGSPSSHAP